MTRVPGDRYTRTVLHAHREQRVWATGRWAIDGASPVSTAGTWSGPSWNENCTLLQLLISVQSMILGVDYPIANEPGYESHVREPGSPPTCVTASYGASPPLRVSCPCLILSLVCARCQIPWGIRMDGAASLKVVARYSYGTLQRCACELCDAFDGHAD